MATLFTDDVVADLTADVTKRLAWIARQPIPSTKKREQEIANEDRQLKRLTDRLAALGKLRDLLQGNVCVTAQVLKALVGDVVIRKQHVDGDKNLQMVARCPINAVPALAVLERRRPTDRDGVPVPVWDSIHSSPGYEPETAAGPVEATVPLDYDRRAAARKPRKT